MVRKTDQILDEILILSAKRGDSKAISLIIKKWQKPVKSFIYRTVNNPSPVNDISQEVWKTVLENIRKLKEPSSYKSWIFRIAYNKSIDWLRAKSQELDFNSEYSLEKTTEVNTSLELEENLRICLKKLPAQNYIVLKLHYLDRMTLNEMSSVLNVPIGTLKSKLFHSREKLKSLIKQYNHEN